MSLENEIKDAFERHATDARPEPGAWSGVRGRIARSHRRRAAGAALATAFAVAAAALFIPKLTREPDNGTAASGWGTLRSDIGGYRLAYPASWTATEANGLADLRPPGRPTGPDGKVWFSVRALVDPTRYDAVDPEAQGVKSSGVIGGHRFVRLEYSTNDPKAYDSHSVNYNIEWQGPHASCTTGGICAQPDYTLHVWSIAQTPDLWQRYGSTFERMVRSVQAVPSTAPPVQKQPTPIAKIPVRAMAVAATQDAVWALSVSIGDGKPGTLSKIDPLTNHVVGTIDVGLAPTGIAASTDAVWVANGNACGIAYSCGQGGQSAPPTPHFPQEYSVWRIDAATMVVTAKTRVSDPSGIAYGQGAVWVGSTSDRSTTSVVRIDPLTNRVAGSVKIQGIQPISLAVGQGSVWAMATLSGDHPDQAVVSTIDPSTNHATTGVHVQLGSTAGDIASGLGSTWATSAEITSASGLTRIDPATGKQVASITLPDAAPIGLLAVTTGEGFVWASSARGYLWKVDPATNSPVGDPLLIGDTPPVTADDVLVAFHSAWVASGDGKIWRLTP